MRPSHLAFALALVALPGCPAGDAGDRQGAAPSPMAAPNTSPAPIPVASVAPWEPNTIGPDDLNQRVAAGVDLLIADVRSKEAWEKEHIKGSQSLPWADIDKRWTTLPKTKQIVLYCA